MRTRLQDIAEDLNLSKMTISRVLRGQTDVSAETKARVLKRMQELNYRPNATARGLRTGQAYRVGLIVPRLNVPSISAVCQAITLAFQGANYGVVVSVSGDDRHSGDGAIGVQLSHHVDAVLLVGGVASESLPEPLRESGVLVLHVGHRSGDGLSVFINELEAGRLPAAHLLGHGARRIAYLRGPRTAAADDRFSGFLKAHREAGVTPRQEWTREVRAGQSEYQAGWNAVRGFLEAKVAPDAVMAHTDALAAGARDAALAHGLKIPESFQVIGSGNESDLCCIGLPLSSVDTRAEELGTRAAKLALKVISGQGKEIAVNIRINPSLELRSTTRNSEMAARGRKGRSTQ